MKTGAAISGLAHAALIAVVIIGLPWFPRGERPPIPVTEVSFVSEADFDRAQSAALAPRDVTAPAEQPRARPATPETPPAPEPEVATPAPEPPVPAPEPPAAEPEVTTLAPEFNPDTPLFAPSTAPEISVAPAPPPTELAAVAPPRARVATTIAPTPTPPAEADVSEEPVPAPAPSPEPVETPTPPAESADAAPEPASETPAPQPAPEPEPEPLALATSARPIARRGNIETAAAPPPPSAPAPTPPATPARPSDLVEQLREEVEREQTRRADATPPTDPSATEPSVTAPTPPNEGTAAATSLPSGPPITTAEREGLRLAVQRCWNLPAGLRDAAELKVTLGAELNADGSVIASSVRLVDPSPAPDARFQQAYEAGRRALLRCAPYADLPRDKYAQWRELEVVFNPEGMVSW